jgi:hypothetical protein
MVGEGRAAADAGTARQKRRVVGSIRGISNVAFGGVGVRSCVMDPISLSWVLIAPLQSVALHKRDARPIATLPIATLPIATLLRLRRLPPFHLVAVLTFGDGFDAR